ncbi:MAG: aminotransferase class I/II-fold pyridoxal phosphate-dependent enzyme [Actinobacteria bacterium]|nr:aminotransferase class I/II-fold pyridoxal phosphate-dependent enzyme [Actinomycetota bacterium]
MFKKAADLGTIAVHAGDNVPSTNRPKVEPIFQTSVFTFDDLDDLDRVQSGEAPGFVYTRFGNPNQRAFEKAVAELEGAADGLACASGMGAIMAALLGQMGAGDHLVITRDMYGGTYALVYSELKRLGIEITRVDFTDLRAVEAAVTARTKVLFAEVMSNPTLNLTDVGAISEIAERHGIRLIVDNTFASPWLVRPIELGAHAVVHSATKYLGGHSDVTAGVLVGPEEIVAPARRVMVNLGASLSPFEAWLTLRGIRTLHLRMERHCANGRALAEFLVGHPRVNRVNYPGLPDFPQRGLAERMLPRGCGGMLSFEVKGGLSAANRVIGNLRLARFAPSLAGVATTTSHPVRTSHKFIPEHEREAMGVTDGLIRVSVGIEGAGDIIDDFRQALDFPGS